MLLFDDQEMVAYRIWAKLSLVKVWVVDIIASGDDAKT